MVISGIRSSVDLIHRASTAAAQGARRLRRTAQAHPVLTQTALSAPLLCYAYHSLKTADADGVRVLLGICNLQGIMFSRFSEIISGVRGRNDELISKFQRQIDAIKGMINSLIDGMIRDLTKELGMDASDFNLDQHHISHAFEDWMEEANVTDLANSAQRAKLKELIRERIGIEETDPALDAILEQHLASDDFTGIAKEIETLKINTEEYLAGHLEAKGGASGADNPELPHSHDGSEPHTHSHPHSHGGGKGSN